MSFKDFCPTLRRSNEQASPSGSFKVSGKPVDFKTSLDFETTHDTKPPRFAKLGLVSMIEKRVSFLQNRDSFRKKIE